MQGGNIERMSRQGLNVSGRRLGRMPREAADSDQVGAISLAVDGCATTDGASEYARRAHKKPRPTPVRTVLERIVASCAIAAVVLVVRAPEEVAIGRGAAPSSRLACSLKVRDF